MKETGVVHAVKDGEVLVRLKRHAACLGCRACSLSSGGEMVIKAIASDKVSIGDQVAIEIDSISIVKAMSFVYLIPAVAFLTGIFAGLKIALPLGIYKHKEIFSILIGGILLISSLCLARWYGVKRSSAYRARVTGIVQD
jgi:positive regulator of sigma E activity